jgi:beta-1,4-mannosyltransferase
VDTIMNSFEAELSQAVKALRAQPLRDRPIQKPPDTLAPIQVARSIYSDTLTLEPITEPITQYKPPRAPTFMQQHRVFLIVLALASLLRVITMIAYFPALWWPDSFGYVGGKWFNSNASQLIAPSLHPYPPVDRPVGYSLILLWPLHVFHNVALVTGVQGLLGMLAGTMIYGLLRYRFKFAGWTATLAASPVLLSAYELQLEHYMLSDTLYMFLTVSALCIALWKRVPWWSLIGVGLLLGGAAITRTEGLPIIAVFAGAVLLSHMTNGKAVSRLRRLTALAALIGGFAIPYGAYAVWFDSVHHHFELESTYGGAFTAARVETFANCSIIKPPANEKWLCLKTPTSDRLSPDDYLWGYSGHPAIFASAPTGTKFSARTSAVAEKFAIHAIEHQPLAYAASVTSMFLRTFQHGPTTDGQAEWMFPASKPQTVQQLAAENPGTNPAVFYLYNGGRDPSTQFRQPYADILRAYQDVMVVPPPVLAAIALVGLIGVGLAFKRRMHGGAAFLPWAVGITMLLVPTATSDYEARYVVAAVPFLAIAAALATREIAWSNKRGYYVFVALILTVFTAAMYMLQDTVWHLNEKPLSGLAHAAWSWGSLVWLGAVLPSACGVIGMVTWRSPHNLNSTPPIRQLVCWRIVSRGLNTEALRATIEHVRLEMITTPLFNYVIEVLVDDELPPGLPAEGPSLWYLVVPREYRTVKGSLFKARALQYAVEKSVLPPNAWIIHLDEETRPTRSGIQGIARMIPEEEASGELRIGQGGILYHRNLREHPFLTLADSIRTGDDLARFHFAYKILGSPLFGFHGSYIVTRNDVEKEVGFDFGPIGSITEDAFWAVMQAQLGRKCRWVEGYMEEQSTKSALDFMKQRRRWFQGLVKVSLHAPVKLRHRMGILVNTAMWALAPISVAYTIAHLFLPGYVEPWIRILANLSLSSFATLYVVGLAINLAQRNTAWRYRIPLMTAQVALLPLFTALEGISVSFGLISRDHGFFVVKK